MSIRFDDPMNDETKELINKFFGTNVVAADDQNVLLERLNEINREEFEVMANTAKQPITLNLHETGEVIEMKDGTKYRVTKNGWRKIQEGK